MAKMRWSKLEWQRKSRTHEALADPHLSVPTERERQKRQSKKKKKKKTGKKTVLRSRRRGARKADQRQPGGSFHVATLRAVERVIRERGTQDPKVIAQELGISEDSAVRYVAEVERRR
jgi:hypothetical protein